MYIFLEFSVWSSSLRRTAASLSEEKRSISYVDMVQAHRASAWSVFTFGLASPTITHQPIGERVENEDFANFHLALSLERWVEARVVGWGR
jgi:hypothetical protein